MKIPEKALKTSYKGETPYLPRGEKVGRTPMQNEKEDKRKGERKKTCVKGDVSVGLECFPSDNHSISYNRRKSVNRF